MFTVASVYQFHLSEFRCSVSLKSNNSNSSAAVYTLYTLYLHLCNLLQQQRPPLHSLLHLLNLLLVLPPALEVVFPAEFSNTTGNRPISLKKHNCPTTNRKKTVLLLISLDLNSLSLFWWVCDSDMWGSLAWARFNTTLCSFLSLCFCFSFHCSSSSPAFLLCSSTFLLRETDWSQMEEGWDGDFRTAGAASRGHGCNNQLGGLNCFGLEERTNTLLCWG